MSVGDPRRGESVITPAITLWAASCAPVDLASGFELTVCPVKNGEVECSFTPCPELECPREEWWLRPGQCCFTCREPTPTTGCTYTGRIFYNNETFPSVLDPCLSCICLPTTEISKKEESAI
ncbi:von Willebrand factor C and EGF domain-containing protein [Cricetulus griseus]|uniref:von Willebrand factor C and EGF domain-containing protein n=1 Tax=Cricetulus griseus TaxID=10029 RepID=G3II68_CRIGR|nr:von Willebrand factor C and EGF domain-containing protein [Cricetulus griseus]